MDTGVANFLNYNLDLSSDYSTQNLNEANKDVLKNRVLETSPYGLQERLDYIRDSGDFEPSYEDMKNHFESLENCPEEFLDKSEMEDYSNTTVQETDSQNSQEKNLEDKVSSDKNVAFSFDFGWQSERKGLDYSVANSYYSRYSRTLYSDFSGITDDGKCEVQDLLQDVQDGKINLQEFEERSNNFSENQKLILSCIYSATLYNAGYDQSYEGDGFSDDESYNAFQNYLSSGDETSLGMCGDISTLTERYGESVGLNMDSASGMAGQMVNHVYNVADLNRITAFINGGKLFIVPTENIEFAFEGYDKELGVVVLSHELYDKGEFQTRFLTKDGKNYNEFVDYDWSSDVLKSSLTNRNNFKPTTGLEISVGAKNYLNSVGINFRGAFFKAGRIMGSESSPLQEMNLLQAGFKKPFNGKYFNINSELSFMYGNLEQDTKLDNDQIFGGKLNFVMASDFDIFNFSTRLNANVLASKTLDKDYKFAALFADLGFGAGASFKIPIKNVVLEPYSVAQFSFVPKEISDLRTPIFKPVLSELEAGAKFNFRKSSLDVHFLEEFGNTFGVGGNINLKNKNLELGLGGEVKWSNYEFNFDNAWKMNWNVGVDFDKLSLMLKGDMEGTNSDGQIDIEGSIGAEMKFNLGK